MNTSIDLTISQSLISNFFHKVYILKSVTKGEFKRLNRIVTSNSTSRGTSTTAMFKAGLVGRGVRQKGLTVRPSHAMNVFSIKRIQVEDGERE